MYRRLPLPLSRHNNINNMNLFSSPSRLLFHTIKFTSISTKSSLTPRLHHITPSSLSSPLLPSTNTTHIRAFSLWGRMKSLYNFNIRDGYEKLESIASENPSKAIAVIEKGWRESSIPINNSTVAIYLNSIKSMALIDKVSFEQLRNNLKANLASAASAYSSSGNTGASSGSGGGSGEWSSRGAKHMPLFVTTVESSKNIFVKFLLTLVSSVILIALFMTLMDSAGAGVGMPKIGGSQSTVHLAEKSNITFDDVMGIEEAKSDLKEIVLYLKNPEKFTRLGGKLPKGVLLTGPPGTGKTLLAKAIAGEASVPFFYTSGSEFEEMFVGVGAKRVRDLFKQANANAPCIIFIDEIDAVGGSRNLKDQSAMKMTLNQLLVEMDGFKTNSGVIVIGATNFPESLDTALTRPGRLDKHVEVPLPDIGGRKEILSLYGKKIPLSGDVDLDQLARGTPGFSGAELANLMNEAALKASIEGYENVTMKALEYAKDKIMMGAERVTAVFSPEVLKTTAYHEAGHAIVSLKTDGADPIHKATIMPRGRALGMVMQLPDGDQTSMSRKQMLARLDICMGGRIAEELLLGPDGITSGASNDFQQATNLATRMVTKWGLSSKLGILSVDEKTASGQTKNTVDEEVMQMLNDSYDRAKKLLQTHRKELDALANALLQYETLSGAEVADIVNGKTINLGNRSQKPSRAPSAVQQKPQAKPQGKGLPVHHSVSHSEASAPLATLIASTTQAQAQTVGKSDGAVVVASSNERVEGDGSAELSSNSGDNKSTSQDKTI